jgi:hypothetical protein
VLWLVATSGGRHLFVKEVLGEAFDSQAEYFLQGDPGIDLETIRPEAMTVNGKVRMYFGPFPALLRIPLNFVYSAGRGMWSRFSGFCAGTIALWSFAGLVGDSLRSSPLSVGARNWLGNACLIGFVFGTPLLYLIGNLSIYNEAIIWGLAWSVCALFFACRAWVSEGRWLTVSLLGFSFSAAAALLSRVTFGMPLLLIAPVLAVRVRRSGWIHFAALAGPLLVGVTFHLVLSYAKFGTFSGVRFDSYINSVHREFVQRHGMFSPARVPYSFSDYFSLRAPSFHSRPPFIEVYRRPLPYPALFSLPNTETYLSLTWASSWLILAAGCGVINLFRSRRSDWFQRCVAAALFVQFLFILSYFALAQRYMAELLPFLAFCLIVFLRKGGSLVHRATIFALVIASSGINILATAYWLSSDGGLPVETRVFWSEIAGIELPK